MRRGAAVLALTTVVLVASQAFGIAAAQAGSYTITANGAQVCALGTFIQNVPGFSTSCSPAGGIYIGAPATGSAYNDRQLWEIDSPSPALTITGAGFAELDTSAINTGQAGYGGGAYWNGGGVPVNTDQAGEPTSFGSEAYATAPFASQYFGLQVVCSDTAGCDGDGTQLGAELDTNGAVTVAVQENQAPGLTAGGLFNQTSGWVWSAPSDPWPLSLSASDPSGICSLAAVVNNSTVSQISSTPNSSTWQQCPSPGSSSPAVDTSSYVPSSGQLSLNVSAENAAQITSSGSATINVDNVQPSVSITPQNDSNPGGWAVNHSVTLRVAPAAGPSGISSVTCTDTLGNTISPLTLAADPSVPGDYDVTIDGNGSHQIACSVANHAVDPQGANNTGNASETVDIDEQPPTISFEATNPSNPDQVIVDTSDNESPVNGGTIQITPQGSSTPVALPTTFNSAGQLIASIPDATLKAGAYTLGASATSQVGNTGTLSEPVTLPLRSASSSIVSFKKIVDPRLAKKLKERVRVGFHYKIEKRHGKKVRVKVGGHFKTITVIKRVERCTTKKVKIAAHKYKLKRTCTAPKLSFTHKATVGHGKKTTIYGELTTSQSVALAGQTVEILTTPKHGDGKTRQIATATTNATGGWSAKVPAGPSRTIKAYFPGTNTILPTSGSGQVTVPAFIKLGATPHQLPWSSSVTLSGHLVGGYVPPDGVAMRLLIKIPGRKTLYEPKPFRTDRHGAFKFKWSFGTGSGVDRLHFAVGLVASESDYPFAAHNSGFIPITFGLATPPT
jgi:hypothetical protein